MVVVHDAGTFVLSNAPIVGISWVFNQFWKGIIHAGKEGQKHRVKNTLLAFASKTGVGAAGINNPLEILTLATHDYFINFPTRFHGGV